ncbi:hypothetical protein PS15m_001729 [Mucor circinelloides]
MNDNKADKDHLDYGFSEQNLDMVIAFEEISSHTPLSSQYMLEDQQANASITSHPALDDAMFLLLFCNVFKETNKEKSAKLNLALMVPSKASELVYSFCLKLKPAYGTCSLSAQERLTLLASDVHNIIEQSKNPDLTVPLLLT